MYQRLERRKTNSEMSGIARVWRLDLPRNHLGLLELSARGATPAYLGECFKWFSKLSRYAPAIFGRFSMMTRFSAFECSAASVKLNEPVITVLWSMMITLLWAI